MPVGVTLTERVGRRARTTTLEWARWWRVRRFRRLSTNQAAFDGADLQTAVLAVGPGSIEVRGVQLGYWPSPGALTTCIHLDTRRADAFIRIGAGSIVNNGCTLIAEGPGISIGRDALIGPGVEIYDSDFHALDPAVRRSAAPAMAHVSIGDNVFIGAHSMLLQGASIGDGAVIGAGSVVVGHVPANTVAAGNPAVVRRELDRGG